MSAIDQLLEIMSTLRDPDKGCPWDKEQSMQSLVPYTLEEAYEVAEVIENHQWGEMPGELGDLLFQVVFYAQIAKEQQRFDFSDVVNSISDKLVRRHPHVFADEDIKTAEDQTRRWEQHKARERSATDSGDSNAMSGVSHALTALTRAQKLQRRAASVGFDWQQLDGVVDKIQEELQECREQIGASDNPSKLEEELGDLLFSCVNLSRHLDLDAESVLRRANRKFERRFVAMENYLSDKGIDLEQASAVQLDDAWEFVKRRSNIEQR